MCYKSSAYSLTHTHTYTHTHTKGYKGGHRDASIRTRMDVYTRTLMHTSTDKWTDTETRTDTLNLMPCCLP